MMERLRDAWFEFKGVMCYERGAYMTGMPTRYAPGLRGEEKTISGRSGTVLVTDGSYDSVEVALSFIVPKLEYRQEALEWLTGTGLLRFSDEPDRAYEARILKKYKRTPKFKHLTGEEYSVTFSCQPFRIPIPEPREMKFTESGAAWYNPGSAPARPRVTILGKGDFSLSIAGSQVIFSNVKNGIIVDSDLMDALTLDGKALANDKISGAPWTIPPGRFRIEWTLNEGAEIDSVSILPRWRYL